MNETDETAAEILEFQLENLGLKLKGDIDHREREMGSSSSFWQPHWHLSIHRSEFHRIHLPFSHARKKAKKDAASMRPPLTKIDATAASDVRNPATYLTR